MAYQTGSEGFCMQRPRNIVLTGIGAFAVAVALTVLDAIFDAGTGVVPEMALDFMDRMILAVVIIVIAFWVFRIASLDERTKDLEGAFSRAADEGRQWRTQSRRFLEGLSQAIDAQFEDWHLTPAESDVAGLLLKGASLREISILRRTSEATIRQQAQNIYRKSGLASRSELSAYFLEDLFTLSEVSVPANPPRDSRFDA